MKRWQIRDYVRKNLKKIEDEALHGYSNKIPNGYLRGVEVLGSNFEEALLRSCIVYFKHHRNLPDLIDPQTFTEKQVLFKFFGLIPTLSPSDKLSSHKFLLKSHQQKIKIPNRIWKSKAAVLPDNNEILPGKYFLKSNHGAGTNMPLVFPVEQSERERLEIIAQNWLTKIHDFRKSLWWYEIMERYIYLEEDLAEDSCDAPDWKFFVCNGRVEIFQVDTGRFGDHVQTIYSRSGHFIGKELYFKSGPPVRSPSFLGDMIDVAEGIGKSFDFIRVDMFIKGRDFFLGEIGLVPNGASNRIISPELDWKLGAAWKAPWMGDVDSLYSTGHYN